MKTKLSENEIISLIREELSLMLGLPVEQINPDDNFEKLRINSIHAMQLLDELEEKLQTEISPLWLWEYPTIRLFSKQIIKGIQ